MDARGTPPGGAHGDQPWPHHRAPASSATPPAGPQLGPPTGPPSGREAVPRTEPQPGPPPSSPAYDRPSWAHGPQRPPGGGSGHDPAAQRGALQPGMPPQASPPPWAPPGMPQRGAPQRWAPPGMPLQGSQPSSPTQQGMPPQGMLPGADRWPAHAASLPPHGSGGGPGRHDARTTVGGVLRVWWAGRVRRLVPRGVPWTAIVLAGLLLAAWILFADILLTPGVVMAFPGETPSRDWGHDVVGWVALLTTFGLGSAAALVLMQVAGPRMRWAALAIPVASTAATLGLVMGGPGQPLPWPLGIGACGAASLGLALAAALAPRIRVHLAVAAGVLLAAQWGLVLWIGATEPTEWVFLSSFTNLAFPVVLAIALVAILAVALYAQQAHARADRLGRRVLLARWVPVVAAAAMLAVVVARMGPLRWLFGVEDQSLWDWRAATSWVHATVAGAVVVWLVARSGARPVRPRRHVGVVLVLAAAAGMPLLGFAVSFALLSVPGSPAAAAAADRVGELLDASSYGAGLVLMLVVLLAIALVPGARRSTGRIGALVALATSVPVQLWLLASIDLGYGGERFAAGPGQIALVMLVIVLALAIWGAARQRDVVDRHILLRLALVPVLTLHAGQLLPGVWREDFEQAAIVVLSLVALLLVGAPRSGTREGAARAFVAPFAVQMALLGSVIVARTMGLEADETMTAISVLYLTIPVSAMLCCRLEEPSDAWARGATTTIDLPTMRRGWDARPVVAPVGAGPVRPLG